MSASPIQHFTFPIMARSKVPIANRLLLFEGQLPILFIEEAKVLRKHHSSGS